MTKTISAAFIFILCLGFSTVAAQNSALDQLFSLAIEAVGGEKEINKIRSLEVFAECTGPNGKYTTEIISFRDGKTRFTQNFSYKPAPTDIFINDKLAWENSNFSLVSPFQKLVVHLHEYQKMAFDFQKMFTDFALEGAENFADKPSIKVRAKNELNGTIYLYFDTDTKLLSGYVLPIPGSNELVKNVFNEWRSVGKLKLPSKVTATDSAGDWVLDFQKISLNKADEKIFEIPPRVADLAELMRLQKQSETAHLTYNAELLIEMFSQNGITEINRGEISTLTKEKGLERFKSYFSRVKFLEWANIKPPVINLSNDGTMATVILQKRVRSIPKNETDEKNLRHFEFVWIEVWKKFDGKWKLVTVASTEKVVENSK